MLHIELPAEPVPAEVLREIKTAQAAVESPASPTALAAAEERLARAQERARAHAERVGMRRITIPREVEAKGPEAIEAYVAKAIAPAPPEVEEAPARSRSRKEA